MTTLVERIASLVVGRVESVTASNLKIALFPETPQATALNTGSPTGFPRINAYVLIPNETGAVVAVVKEVFIYREASAKRRDDSLVDLPFPARTMIAVPFGTLMAEEKDSDHQRRYRLTRGVPVLPSVGDPVDLPTAHQLRSIVEAESKDRLVLLGTAPFAGNARVWVHPDKIFGRHLAVLGNTGSGKSCSVAGVVRWSLEAARAAMTSAEDKAQPNARFIILDPNGEYQAAFVDGKIPVRRFAVGGQGGAQPLTVPGWLWNSQEWAAFTAAQGGVQRPILLRALRLLRNAGAGVETARAQILRRYRGYITQLERLFADAPGSIQGFPNNRNVGELFEGLVQLFDLDIERLTGLGEGESNLTTAITALGPQIEQIRSHRFWTSQSRSGYNDFQPGDIEGALSQLNALTTQFPIESVHGEISEDYPVKFAVAELPGRIHEVALATSGQAVSNVEPLINRIQVMLGDARLRPIVESDVPASLADWLKEFLGANETTCEPLAIVDLSLVPSDIIHIAVAVIARLVFEALQRFAKENGNVLPTVIVLEEAHTFVRKDVDQGVNAQAGEVCRQVFDRIAREGRKFGLGLVLASQRPSELSPTVLAQCNTFLLHRIVNDIDQNLVRRLVPDALGGLLAELPSLPTQEAILLGWAVPTPALVKIRDLKHRPRSEDPDFWDVWMRAKQRPAIWDELASRWERGETGRE
jgi:uncharacterized protein